MFQDHIASQKA